MLALALAVAACVAVPTIAPTARPTPAPTDAPPSTAPSSDAGTPFESTRYGYRLVIPDGWTISETPGAGGLHPDEAGVDTFRSGTGLIVSVVGEAIAVGTTLDDWTCAINTHLTDEHATTAESTEIVEVADHTARVTRYHLRFDPYAIYYQNAELIDGSVGLTISMESTTNDDSADEMAFRALLDSLTLAG